MALPSADGAKPRCSLNDTGKCGIGKGYELCLEAVVLGSYFAFLGVEVLKNVSRAPRFILTQGYEGCVYVVVMHATL